MVDGHRWSPWSACSKTCGGGVKYLNRTCNNPAPLYGGKACSGHSFFTHSCNVEHCPVNGRWSHWTNWTICSVSCGHGVIHRSRTCNNPAPAHGGLNCTGNDILTKGCNAGHCPVNGGWSHWTGWSKCSATCSEGIQSHKRQCNNPVPSHGGKNCIGNDTATKICNVRNCPIDGGWSSWSGWTKCSTTCNNGTVSRYRQCNNPAPTDGGTDCIGNNISQKGCNVRDCPVDGGWSLWSKWSICSATCGNGTKSRQRQCNNPTPSNGGRNCTGQNITIRHCHLVHCPVHGGWSKWANWSKCSLTCGNGNKSRQRQCNNPVPLHGGANCSGTSIEHLSCHQEQCPIDGGWSIWTNWTTCSVSCGEGIQYRNRTCSSPPPANGGADCNGYSAESAKCRMKHCPLDGMWSPWLQWTGCSTTCDVGSRSRRRTCTNPAPAYGGRQCKGYSSDTQTCNNGHCPGK